MDTGSEFSLFSPMGLGNRAVRSDWLSSPPLEPAAGAADVNSEDTVALDDGVSAVSWMAGGVSSSGGIPPIAPASAAAAPAN